MTFTGTASPYGDAAWAYRKAGWQGVIPVGYGRRRKSPPHKGYTGWTGLDPSGPDVQTWVNGREAHWNIGLHLPHGVVAVDVDAYHGGDRTLARLTADVGHPLPATWSSTARGADSASRQRLYRAYPPPGRVWMDHPGGHRSGIDAVHVGHRYTVTWPSINPDADGAVYMWYDPTGEEYEGVPQLDWLTTLDDAWVAALTKEGVPVPGEAADDETTREAVERFPRGPACYPVASALKREMERIAAAGRGEGGLHDPGRIFHLVSLAIMEGHAGVAAALSEHQETYVAARVEHRRASPDSAGQEWWRSVRGAVGKLLHATGGEVAQTCSCRQPGPQAPDGGLWDAPLTEEDQEAARVALEVQQRAERIRSKAEDERVRREAKRLVDGEEAKASFRPPVEYGTLADELALPEEPIAYRIDQVMPAGANTVITAQFKTGKTTLVNNMVKSLADGKPFLGRYPVDQLDGRVGIFNYEVGAAQYRRWMRDTDIEHTERVALLHLRGMRLPLTAMEDWIVDWLIRHEVEVWILDPFARAMVGSGDESDNTEVGVFTDTIDVIKERAGVKELIMPAHTGRAEQEIGKERARGASRLDDWADVRWILTKDDEGSRFLRCSGRDVEEPEQRLRYRHEDRSLVGEAGFDRAGSRRSGLQGQILPWLVDHPGANVNEVYGAFPNRKAEVAAALRMLTDSGQLRVEAGPNRAKLHYPTGIDPASRSGPDREPPWAATDHRAGIR
jgi:hypothetical protein